MSSQQLLKIYYLLRETLGEKLGLLGQYEFLVDGSVAETDWAIAVPHLKPDPKLKFQMKLESGIEAILEGDRNLDAKFHHGHVIMGSRYKLVLSQHDQCHYGSLEKCVQAVYSIPAIKPLDSPVFRPRHPVGDSDRSYLPASAFLSLVSRGSHQQ